MMMMRIPTLPTLAGETEDAPTTREPTMIGMMIIFSNRVKMVPNMLIHLGRAVTPLAARMMPATAPMTRPMRILYSTLKFRYARRIPPFLGSLFAIDTPPEMFFTRLCRNRATRDGNSISCEP